MTSARSRLLVLAADDDIAVALDDLAPGERLDSPSGAPPLTVRGPVPRGHKIALREVAAGAPVRKYGQIIGVAAVPIPAGEHVHTHNLEFAPGMQGGAAPAGGAAASSGAHRPRRRPPPAASGRAPPPRTFEGYVRSDGRVATRNFLGVLTTVNCSATAAKRIAQAFQVPGALDEFPHVDGVVALTHGTGCGMAGSGEGWTPALTLTGYANHPNFAGFLLLGLGCEVNEVASLAQEWSLPADKPVHTMTIQEFGGTTKTVREGMARIREMLPEADKARRQTVPATELVLGMECGGSDSYSGITANPALGAAADLVVRHGGTACFGETPEIYGAEHLLARPAQQRRGTSSPT